MIAYFVLRQDDSSLAKNCLYLGIALTVIHIVLTLILDLALISDAPV